MESPKLKKLSGSLLEQFSNIPSEDCFRNSGTPKELL
jgi:hypothetical protein